MDTEQPIDVTDILAQPREFAQRLARVERERAELIETVARLRAECNDAQAVARAYILRAERAESEVARLRLALEDAYTVGDVVQMRLYIAAALRQPAPARCVCGHTPAMHDAHGYCGECACDTFTAPAQGQE